ncbi:MAG: c-type cytochrome, partial [Anaerolineae bacterium]
MSRPRRRAMLGVARVLVTLALVLGLLPVYAQQPDPGQVAVDEGLVFRASRLTGAEVLNQDGQTLGEVEGFLVRWAPADQAAAGAQQVAYVLVGAENLVAVPAELFSFDARDQTFRLEISELELTEAPGLQLSPDAEWEQGLFDYWSGLGSALEQPPSEANLVRAGHLDGSPIVSEDQEVGVVEDLLIQLAPAESAASPEPGLTGTPEGEETPTVTGTPETEVTPEAAQTPEVTGTPAPEGTPQATPAAEVEPSKEAVAAGRLVAQSSGCLGCHSTDGTTRVGPTWQDLYGSKENLEDGTTVEVDTEYLRRSILDPDAQIVRGFPSGIMPHTYDLQLSEEDINNVIAYIMSLSQVPVGQEPEATEAAPEETEEPTAVPEEVEEATPGAELTPEAKPTAPDEPIALRVVYVVASLSPDLGADSQRVVLPAGLLDYERDQRQFRLRQGVDMLPDAPAFNPAELRGGAPADWDDPISEFWAGLPASVPVTPESTPSAGTTPAPDVTETPAPKE